MASLRRRLGAGAGVAAGALATCTLADGGARRRVPSQTGQDTSRASFWRSNSAPEANQPSNACPLRATEGRKRSSAINVRAAGRGLRHALQPPDLIAYRQPRSRR